MSKEIEIYTDGGCRGNPGLGGWGAVLYYDNRQYIKEIKGAVLDTTNNRMELTAVIFALKQICKNDLQITLYTDSQYVFNGITKWYVKWQRKNWRGVKNPDLWQELIDISSTFKYKINWQWLRGHSGNNGNELADKLANMAMDEFENK